MPVSSDEEPWQLRAACVGRTDLFFPIVKKYTDDGAIVVDRKATAAAAKRAKAICARCPVIMECRAWAVATSTQGIAGGWSARQVKKERKRLHLPDPPKEE